MISREDLEKMARLIGNLRNTAEELVGVSHSFPALNRNTKRILASVKMLEINLPDRVSFFHDNRER
jgi:hypothetical protein